MSGNTVGSKPGSIATASTRWTIALSNRHWACADCHEQLKVVGFGVSSPHALGRNQVTMTSLQHMRRLNTGRVRSSHDLIARTIGKEILTGTWAPGANLPPEATLMERFGVSRTVLREVMKTLSAKGLAVVKRMIAGEPVTQEHSGMSKGEWRELMEVLEMDKVAA